MAPTPDDASHLGEQIRRAYEDLELGLVARIARALGVGKGTLGSALGKRGALGRAARRLLDRLNAKIRKELPPLVVEAYDIGADEAAAEVRRLRQRDIDQAPARRNPPGGRGREQPIRPPQRPGRHPDLPGPADPNGLAERLIRDFHPQVLRGVDDIYRRLVAETYAPALAEGLPRREASQRLLERFAVEGITGFTDKAGRRWNIVSYSEMAMRAAFARATLAGALDRYRADGIELVGVPDIPFGCNLCLLPGTTIEGPAPTFRSRTEYAGDVVRITTAAGKHLVGTPEHPVLTLGGWRVLKSLRPGDQVISIGREQRATASVGVVVPDDVQVPTLIEEAGKSVAPLLLAGPARRQLNDGVAYREVRAVSPDGDLLAEWDVPLGEPLGDHLLVRGIGAAARSLAEHDPTLGLVGHDPTTIRFVHGVEHLGSLLRPGFFPAAQHHPAAYRRDYVGVDTGPVVGEVVAPWPSLLAGSADVIEGRTVADPVRFPELHETFAGSVPLDELGRLGLGELPAVRPAFGALGGLHALAAQDSEEVRLADAEGGLKLLRRLAGTVTPDEIVNVEVRAYRGHVWDLTTDPGWFFANGIVTHNCTPFEGKVLSIRKGAKPPRGIKVYTSIEEAFARGFAHPNCRHNLIPITGAESARVLQQAHQPHDEPGYQATQRQRLLERRIREAKRVSVALEESGADPAARRKARDEVRARQAAMRQFLAAHPQLMRYSSREQVRKSGEPVERAV